MDSAFQYKGLENGKGLFLASTDHGIVRGWMGDEQI
jgi:hypothetical protein